MPMFCFVSKIILVPLHKVFPHKVTFVYFSWHQYSLPGTPLAVPVIDIDDLWLLLFQYDGYGDYEWIYQDKKGRDLTQSYDKSPFTHRKIQKKQ